MHVEVPGTYMSMSGERVCVWGGEALAHEGGEREVVVTSQMLRPPWALPQYFIHEGFSTALNHTQAGKAQ